MFHLFRRYEVASISRLLQIIGLFCRIQSLLQGSFVYETYKSFAQEHYKRDDILQKRRMILRMLLIIAMPYIYVHTPKYTGTRLQISCSTVQQQDGLWENVWSAYFFIFISIYAESLYVFTYRVHMCIYMLHLHIHTLTCAHLEVHLHMHAQIYEVSRFKRMMAIDDVRIEKPHI